MENIEHEQQIVKQTFRMRYNTGMICGMLNIVL